MYAKVALLKLLKVRVITIPQLAIFNYQSTVSRFFSVFPCPLDTAHIDTWLYKVKKYKKRPFFKVFGYFLYAKNCSFYE